MRLKAKFEGRDGVGAGHRDSANKKPSSAERDFEAVVPSPAARNLAMAHHIERLIERGLIEDYTQAARMLGVSQPRMSHLMGLLMLAPAIQEAVLLGRAALRDKELRKLARVVVWERQLAGSTR